MLRTKKLNPESTGLQRHLWACLHGYLVPGTTISKLPSVSPSNIPLTRPSLSTSAVPSHIPSKSMTPSDTPSMVPSQCNNYEAWEIIDEGTGFKMTCENVNTSDGCFAAKTLGESGGRTVYEACCTCGGGNYISVPPSTVPSYSPAPSDIYSPTPSQCQDEYKWKTADRAATCEDIKRSGAGFCVSELTTFNRVNNPPHFLLIGYAGHSMLSKTSCVLCGIKSVMLKIGDIKSIMEPL
jgi:hypothetical protein